MSAPERPDPPVVGKVSHNSIELYWDSAAHKTEHVGLPSTRADSRLHFVIQEEETGLNRKGYGTVYSGYASKHVFEGLEPKTEYRYRLRASNDEGESAWSAPVEVTTTKKPVSSEDLHKAIARHDTESLDKLLAVLNKDLINAPDKYGYSPLMIAVQKGYINMAEILLAHHADVNYQSSSGKTAAMVAAYAGRVDGLEILAKHKANFDLKDRTGSVALHWAIDGKSFEVVRWMVNKNVQLDAKDYTSHWTPLMRLAATSGDENIGRILIHHGSNVNCVDVDGKSVLMMAALNGHIGLVKLLISKGANISQRSEHGKTALDFAKSFDHRQVTLFLEEEIKRVKLQEKEKRKMELVKEQRSGFELKEKITS
eukprot:gene16795-18490_t